FFHIPELQRGGTLPERFEHLILDLYGQYFARLADPRREAEGEIAGPGPQVRDHLSASKSQGVDHRPGAFLVFALLAIQPGDAAWPHHLGDFPAQIEFPGAVRVMSLAGFVEGLGWRTVSLKARNR